MKYYADVKTLEVEIDEVDVVYSELDALESTVRDCFFNEEMADKIKEVKDYYLSVKKLNGYNKEQF